MKVGIFYGSTTGVTEDIANKVGKLIEGQVMSASDIEKIVEFDLAILATSTWGLGDLQDDWMSSLNVLKKINLSGKKIALIGVGDQVAFSSTFVDGIKDIYDVVKENGGEIVGETSIDGYTYDDSRAEKDGMFVGLVIDEVNQSNLTEERIEQWVSKLK
nr:flavodoxin [uncultured Cetobacterium sp.]